MRAKPPAQLAKGSCAQPLPSDLLPPLPASCPSHPKTRRQTNPGLDSPVVPCPSSLQSPPKAPTGLRETLWDSRNSPSSRRCSLPPLGVSSGSPCVQFHRSSPSPTSPIYYPTRTRNGSDHFTWFSPKALPPSHLPTCSLSKSCPSSTLSSLPPSPTQSTNALPPLPSFLLLSPSLPLPLSFSLFSSLFPRPYLFLSVSLTLSLSQVYVS